MNNLAKKLLSSTLMFAVAMAQVVAPVQAFAMTFDGQVTSPGPAVDFMIDDNGQQIWFDDTGNVTSAPGSKNQTISVTLDGTLENAPEEVTVQAPAAFHPTQKASAVTVTAAQKNRRWLKPLTSRSTEGKSLPSIEALDTKNTPKIVQDEIIIQFTDAINISNGYWDEWVKKFLDQYGLKIKTTFDEQNLLVATMANSTETVESLTKTLAGDERVQFSQPNHVYTFNGVIPYDDKFTELYGLHNTGQNIQDQAGIVDADIDMPEAWDIFGNLRETVVAVLDTGVMYTHPDLNDIMWDGTNCVDMNNQPLGGCVHGYDVQNGDKEPLDDDGHGTHVAGTIAAEIGNGRGIAGINPEAKIMAVKIGSYFLTDEDIIGGIKFAQANGADMINASFGGGGYSQAMYDAIKSFTETNGPFIAASGNWGINVDQDYGMYPCGFDIDGVICVAATDNRDELADFSNFGMKSVDLAAPGVDILSTVPSKEENKELLYETFDGDSVENFSFEYDSGVRELPDPYWANVIATNMQTPYASNSKGRMVHTKRYDLTDVNSAALSFWVECDTEYNKDYFTDYLKLSYSVRNGLFEEVYRFDERSIDDWTGGDNDSTGSATMHFTHNLPAKYLDKYFQFKFDWYTNGNDQVGDGCVVDDIVLKTVKRTDYDAYDYNSGTSMATPHVVGVASLMKSHAPELNAKEIKDILMKSGDFVPALANKVISERRLNAANAVKMTRDYVYRNGSRGGSSSVEGSTPAVTETTMTINNGAKRTLSREVVVSVEAATAYEHMAVAQADDFSTVALQSYRAVFPYSLTGEMGEKTVFVKLYDKNGATKVVSATIELIGEEQIGEHHIFVEAKIGDVKPGDLIKSADHPAVYYFGAEGQRHVFVNEKVFKSWFTAEDFKTTKVLTRAELGSIPLGQPILYRPGMLIKEPTSPRVYAVGMNGTLHWIASEKVAQDVYGKNWQRKVKDLGASQMSAYSVADSVYMANALPDQLKFNRVHIGMVARKPEVATQ